jgi:hypothetical protein
MTYDDDSICLCDAYRADLRPGLCPIHSVSTVERNVMPNGNLDVSNIHKDQLLTVLMYHCQPEMRRILMLEVPAAYNEWCGRKVVYVSHTSDGSEVVR